MRTKGIQIKDNYFMFFEYCEYFSPLRSIGFENTYKWVLIVERGGRYWGFYMYMNTICMFIYIFLSFSVEGVQRTFRWNEETDRSDTQLLLLQERTNIIFR